MNILRAIVWGALLSGCVSVVRVPPEVSLDEARAIVSHAEQGLVTGHYCLGTAAGASGDRALGPVTAVAPWADRFQDEPEALDDALHGVLRADRIDQFGPAIDFVDGRAAEQTGEAALRSRTLSAQLLLAWAEAELIVAEVLLATTHYIEDEMGRIAAERALGGERIRRRERVREVRDALERAARISVSFEHVGQVRMSEARQRVMAIASDHPDHYLTYRLLADVYRMDRDWVRFDRVLVGLERRRADGTGLKFLRGAAAIRRGDPDGLVHLSAALDDEPRFARAQVFRVLAMRERADVDQELSALARISPHHQLVEWIAPLLRRGRGLGE